MRQTKIISSLLSFTIFLSCSVLAVDAKTSIDESNSLASRLESSGQLEQINPNESYSNVISSETVTSDLQATISSSDLLDYCSISDETINHSALVEDASNSNIVREVYLEDGSVIGMDDAYNILSITDFSSEDSSDDVLYGQNSTIEQVVSYYGLQDNYQCNIEDDINGYIKYTWEKILSDGIVNPYDSVTLILDKDTYAIRVLNRFNEVAPVQTTAITEEQAKQIALTCQENFEAVTACKLTYVQPNFFWNEEQIAYEPCDILELVYECVIDNQYIVDVDAETGEIIGGDSYKQAAGSFAYSGFQYANASQSLAQTGFSKLGYSTPVTYVGNTKSLGDKIKSFLKRSDAYAFYVDCHGSSNTIGDNKTWSISSSSITGNWHFVFLDACSTASNSTWASAFKVNGYSKRAFLGWKTTVTVGNAYKFNNYFWNEVHAHSHSSNVRDAAVWAASKVPGSGTTPIRFYGDSTYNGKAY